MLDAFYALPLWELALVIFAGLLLLAACVDLLLGLLQPTRVGRAAAGLTNNTHQLVATLTALVMAFLASSVWTDGNEARNAVRSEARALRQAVELSVKLPPPVRDDFLAAAQAYVDAVVAQEWPAMVAGSSSPVVRGERMRMVGVVAEADIADERDTSLHRWMMDALDHAAEARARRLDLAGQGITPIKWLVVIVLATVTLLTVGFCHIDKPGARRIALTLYATAVSAMVFLIYSHDRPFTGEIQVDPAPLVRAVQAPGV